MKKVKICDREFDIDCNALTYIQYRKNLIEGYSKILK